MCEDDKKKTEYITKENKWEQASSSQEDFKFI